MAMNNQTMCSRLRDRFSSGEMLLFMGAGDIATGKLIEIAGYDGVAVQSFQVATQWGLPDGMMTPSDDVEFCFKLAGEIDSPIIYDMFNGYGGPAQASFWMQRLERAGVAALHIDDLAGDYVGGAAVVGARAPLHSVELTAEKIARMAADRKSDLIIIGRTLVDLVDGHTVDDAIERLREYRQAGAEVLFAPVSLRDDAGLRAACEALDAPLIVQSCPSGYYPLNGTTGNYIAGLSFSHAHELGARGYIFPQVNILGFAAIKRGLQSIKQADTIEVVAGEMWAFDETIELGGYRRYGIGYA